ncbi:MAG: hypothetical protein R3F48_06970 [Candidatus Zixiibacteriota bacterium]
MWRLIFTLLSILAVNTICHSRNSVDIRINTGFDDDTIRTGCPATVDFYIENDFRLIAFNQMPSVENNIRISWDLGGGNLLWQDIGGYGSFGCVNLVPCTRLTPIELVFEIFQIEESGQCCPATFDGISPDCISPGATNLLGDETGLLPGPLVHVLSYNFIIDTVVGNMGYVSLQGDYYNRFHFIGDTTSDYSVVTTYNGHEIMYTYPVINAKRCDSECGDTNCDGSVNVGDVVHMINYIFKGGEEPCARCE